MKLKFDGSSFMHAFDILPSMIFIVDKDVRVKAYNSAAANWLAIGKQFALDRYIGDVLYCAIAEAAPGGCGREKKCTNCSIRNSVRDTLQGRKNTRLCTRLELLHSGTPTELYALVTTTPIDSGDKPLAVLTIDEISEIKEIQKLLPICSVCKKIRTSRNDWTRLESYFMENWNISFSHGICPECYEREIAKMPKKMRPKAA